MNRKIMVLLLLLGGVILLVGCRNNQPPNDNDIDIPIEEIPKVKLNYEYTINGNLGKLATSYADLMNEHLRSKEWHIIR